METNKTLWVLAWIFIFCLLMETQMIRGLLEKQEAENRGAIDSLRKDRDNFISLTNGAIKSLRLITEEQQGQINQLKSKKWHR